MVRKKKPKVGRPEAIIDWKKVEQYLMAQCDGASIARLLGIHPDTLYDKVVEKYGEEYNISNFSEFARLKKTEGKELLRATQFQTAIRGDKGMQIWLGKQLLGQKEKGEMLLDTPPEIKINVTSKENADKLNKFLNGGESK